MSRPLLWYVLAIGSHPKRLKYRTVDTMLLLLTSQHYPPNKNQECCNGWEKPGQKARIFQQTLPRLGGMSAASASSYVSKVQFGPQKYMTASVLVLTTSSWNPTVRDAILERSSG